ncbi:type II CRISPR-associated endonuclease Cas1 [Marinoscillum furvescens]|uniref:CRISPR-associated endonuclease Cas1 n=1 Tax=Marinoscillum furvescens DSM 4134 TaxID=1122208 RepID=A0A3D9KXY2_MARFU|nr:type II CRISPR-associated endonuclease Cas1 [Marinoscillum furvescens]RED94092.1 CRISPR-associated protein Cas1 [Marinoscillum furvescens DSM 4134]
MIKRTLYFANPAHLSVHKRQLKVSYPDDQPSRQVPIEDIGLLLLEDHRITLSHHLLSSLLEVNAAIITCDSFHLPQGLLLRTSGSHTYQEQLRHQLGATEAFNNRLWQQTISAKIENQAALLRQNGLEVANMERWASIVKPGDPENLEGRAAAHYWKLLFEDHLQAFKRGRFEGAPNNLLNYGYAILRATVARALAGSGLLLAIGFHHSNKYNAYCLADDVMEPYRPYVDEMVLELVRSLEDYDTLTPPIKKELLKIPTLDVSINSQKSPLMLAVQQTSSSLAKVYSGELKQLKLPKL